MNLKTIKIVLDALHIAKEHAQIAFSSNQLDCRINKPDMPDEYLARQSIIIDSIDDYEQTIGLFETLRERNQTSL